MASLRCRDVWIWSVQYGTMLDLGHALVMLDVHHCYMFGMYIIVDVISCLDLCLVCGPIL